MDAIGAGFETAAKVGGESAQNWLTAQIETERAARVAEIQSEYRMKETQHASGVRLSEEETIYQRGATRAPDIRASKVADTTATEQAKLDVALDPTNVQAGLYKSEEEARSKSQLIIDDAIAKGGNKDYLKSLSAVAAASRDPVAQAAAQVQLEVAKLNLGKVKGELADTAELKGLISSRNAASQGGADAAGIAAIDTQIAGKKNVISGGSSDEALKIQTTAVKLAEEGKKLRESGNEAGAAVFENAAQELLQRAKSAQGAGGATGKTVAIGDVVDGYKFKGGDPKVKTNWEKSARSSDDTEAAGSSNLIANAREFKSLSEKISSIESNLDKSPNPAASEKRLRELRSALAKLDGWSIEKANDVIAANSAKYAPQDRPSMLGGK
jgi:hypothetical protein